MNRLPLPLLVFQLITFNLAGAQPSAGTAPATAPSTQELTPPDPSTPKGALKCLSLAMQNGDEPAMCALLLASNDQEKRIVEVELRNPVHLRISARQR